VEILRRQLREKFPQAHGLRPEREESRPLENLFSVEAFPAGAITEVIPAGPGAGLSLLVAGLLGDPETAGPHPEMILVDGADAFDPGSFSGAACSKLLWVRCRSAMEMLKSADLLVRDGNVPFVLIDSSRMRRRDLTGVPASSWWRLKQNAESNGTRLLVLSSFPLVPCASLRLSLSADLSIEDFDRPRTELLGRLRAVPQRLRHAT
jgi:hypothetical protein